MSELTWVYDDGGREAAGFRGGAGDCVCRAIAIATCQPYRKVYAALNAAAEGEKIRGARRKSSARTGVYKPTYTAYLKWLGWEFVPTMRFGSGCTVHLRADELPTEPIIVRLSKHLAAVVDGEIRDTADPSRQGTRCVYGYFHRKQATGESNV